MLTGIAKDSTGYRYFLGIDGKWTRYDGVNFGTKGYDRFSFFHYAFKDLSTDRYTKQYVGNTLYKYGKDINGIAYEWGVTGDSLIWVDVYKNKKEVFQFPAPLREERSVDFFPNAETCWLTTSGKIFRFDIYSKKFTLIEIPTAPQIELMRLDPLYIFSRLDGSSYLLSENTIWKLDNNSTSLQKFCTLPKSTHLAPPPEIIMDRYLFVALPNAIMCEVDLENDSLKEFDLRNYTNIKNAEALKITSLKNYNNYLLVGTSNAGMFIYNRCTNSVQHFQYEKQNADERIRTYMPSRIKAEGVCNNCNNVRAIYALDKNNLLIGTLQGVYNFDLASEQFSDLISPVNKKLVLSDRPISGMTGDGHGNIFIASWTNEGILLLNSKKKKLINILKPKDHPEFSYGYMRCLFYDSHHVLWVGTNEGLLRITNLDDFEKNNFNGKLNVADQFAEEHNHTSFRPGPCFAFNEDANGNIWIGCVDGLYIYNYKTDSVIKYVHVPGDIKSLSDNEVLSILFAKDNDVWIGTNSGGLNHFDVYTNTFTSITTENGLPNNSIYTILEDNNGFLWLGTNAGLCRFNKTDHSVRNYTPRDGIQNFEFNTNAVCTTTDGRFCFGGRTGFNIFQPDSMNTTIRPPKVVITKFKIFDKEYPVSDSVLHLSHEENSFSFDFAVLNYYRSNDNQYAYMMEGADKDWIKSGSRHYTGYNNLSPGEYTFKVHAANYTGAWNDSITAMKFIINPAWYNTFWFRIAIALLIAAAIYGLHRYRLAQVMKLQAVRNRIASDLHDEIGSMLSSISLSSTIIQRKLNGSNTEVEKLLEQVSNNTDNMMEALSDIVWAINTRNDHFDNTVNRMRAFAIEILEPSNISIQFHVSEDILNIHLNMQQRKNLYLIFKEAVNNIAKYAQCKNVRIDISREANRIFVLNIKDDGKGFHLPTPNNEEKSLSGNGSSLFKNHWIQLFQNSPVQSNFV